MMLGSSIQLNSKKLDIQISALTAQGVLNDRLLSDKTRGKDTDRPGFAILASRAEDGDEVLVTKLDRLGRNTRDMITIVEQLQRKDVSLTFLDDNLSTKGDFWLHADHDPFSNGSGRACKDAGAHKRKEEWLLWRTTSSSAGRPTKAQIGP